MPDLHDIADPEPFLTEPSTPWWIWLLLGLGILSILILALAYFRKPSEKQRRETLLDKARKDLKKLKSAADNLPPHQVATRISLIIRRYLEAAFNDPALFETNEEFTLRPNALNNLTPESRQAIITHLSELSRIKYAPQEGNHPTSLIGDAETLLAKIELHVSPASSPSQAP